MEILLALAVGFILDLIFGDPRGFPHPVVLMGKLIAVGEGLFRRLFPKTGHGEFWAGLCLVVLVCLISFGLPFGLLFLAGLAHPLLALALQAFWAYQLLATKSLWNESMKVFTALARGDLAGARTAVSYIVGRDTGGLDEAGVSKAAVETVAENTADGVVAPMLFFALGGAPLAMLYKAVNTMDSMLGYRNDRYRHFGTAAARLDDAANLLPARISALLMIMASALLGMGIKNAWRIWWRDRYNHKSPNSAQTESVAAGALGVQLAGPAYYFGVLSDKPTIGDPLREISPKDIPAANRLMVCTSFLCLLFCEALRLVLILY